jgi:hypothetical protein
LSKLEKLLSGKLRRHAWERQIWEAICRYANGKSDSGEFQVDFETLLAGGMNWVGGDYDDIQVCRDLKEKLQSKGVELRGSNQPEIGPALKALAALYLPGVRNILTWLSDPGEHRNLALYAADFLRKHGTDLTMHIGGNASFDSKDAESLLLSEYWPNHFGSVMSPVCKFVLEQIDRHDRGGEQLRDVIPVGTCKRCGNFFLVERAGRKQFCGVNCRSGFRQDHMTPEQKAERMRNYRAGLKEMKRKRMQSAEKGKRKK